MRLDILKLVTPKFLATFFFLRITKRMKALRYSKEEDSLIGIMSDSFLWGRFTVGAGWGGFKRVVTYSGFGPNIVEKCSEETQNT